MIKQLDKKDLKKYIWSAVFIFFGVLLLFALFSGKVNKNVSDFLMRIENATFDTRQRITANSRVHNKDIIILAIDDSTYEYVLENYGDWPMPRYIYSDVVNYIEAQNPKAVAFDLIFAKSIKDEFNSDARLSEVFKKYKNVYTAIAFDNQDKNLRTPPKLDEKYAVNLDNKANISIFELTNYRPLLQSILDNTQNIGHINVFRSEDGVIREYMPFVLYQGKIYPHMSLLVAQNLLNSNDKNYSFDKNLTLNFDKKSYPITPLGTVLLNWYGKSQTFEHVSMAKVMKSVELQKSGKKSLFEKDFFKDKIIYVGTTVSSLHDIKTVPTEENLAGVETHATFVNNMLDNSFVHRLTFWWDFWITLMLCLFIGVTILTVESSKINYKYFVPINSLILLGTLALYYGVTIFVMAEFNLWIAVVMPSVGLILTFTAIYIVKYFFKSKDYEYTYRLATTDGLTELFNHRYFQEQMIKNIEISKSTGKKFSLILTDIDFFKKFNDQYGHQAGDAVLRQVARTLKKNVKNSDIVCRYGGEEMSVILPHTDNQAATVVAQNLCKAVAETVYKLSSTLESHVTISLGVATYPENGTTPTELIEYSDKGLYFAKENGRNQVGVIKN